MENRQKEIRLQMVRFVVISLQILEDTLLISNTFFFFFQCDFFQIIYTNWKSTVDVNRTEYNREEKVTNGKVKSARLVNINLDKIRITCNFHPNTCRTKVSKRK